MDLFDYAHARTSDVATSHEAVPHNLSKQAARVLEAYRLGFHLLDEDAYARVGLVGHQRCSDLREAGLIERVVVNGVMQRGRTEAGKAGYLCRITDAGLDFLHNK